mgnify:CR=1 FL=1
MVMAFPQAQIPEHVRQALFPFTGPLPWDDIDLRAQALPQAHAPLAVVCSARMAYPHALTAVAMTIGTDIYIDPAYYDFYTAAGLSLIVHEAVHVRQFLETPNFLAEYNWAEQFVPADQPWLNPWEGQAYAAECEAYDYYVSAGLPPGSWLPLGKLMNFCPC